LYLRSLAILEKSLGKEHPYIAKSFSNLAKLYQAQKKYKEAEPLYQHALFILKKNFPNGHPDIDLYQADYDSLKRKMAEQ